MEIIKHGYGDYPWEAREAMSRSYFHDDLIKEALAAMPDSLSDEGIVYFLLIMNTFWKDEIKTVL